MRTRNIIFLFFFLLVIPICLGLGQINTTENFFDDFNYTNVENDGDWVEIGNACDPPDMALTYQEQYGRNATACASGGTNILRRTIAPRVITESFTFSYDLLNDVDTIEGGQIEIELAAIPSDFESGQEFSIIHRDSGENTTTIYNRIGGENCTFYYDLDHPKQRWELIADTSTNRWTMTVDGVSVCNRVLGTEDFNISAITIDIGFDNGEDRRVLFDNINLTKGAISPPVDTTCDYPLIFCDSFDYATPMMDQNVLPYNARLDTYNSWFIYTGTYTADSTFTPTSSALELLTTTPIEPYHDIEVFDYPSPGIQGTDGLYVIGGFSSSQMASEFLMNISDGCLRYSVDSNTGKDVFDIRGCNESDVINWDYYDGSTWVDACDSCGTRNSFDAVKIVTNFRSNPDLPYNSTFTESLVSLVINNITQSNFSFLDDEAININKFRLIKEDTDLVVIDNYYVMVGSDKFTDTTATTQDNAYNPTQTNVSLGTGEDDDIATIFSNIYPTLGLKSQASKIIASMFIIMFVTAAFLVGSFKMGANFMAMIVGAIIIDLLLVLTLTYLQLLPSWITIVLLIAGAGVGSLILKQTVFSDG